MLYPDDVYTNFPPGWKHQIQQSDDQQCFVDFYRTIYVPGRFTEVEIEQTVQKCRDVIINWSKTASIYFNDGRAAPLQKKLCQDRQSQTKFEPLSTAAKGNFLQALNMSLHVFEQHQADCSFYRTGQMIIAITAGVGVFEVDYRPEHNSRGPNYSESSTESSTTATQREFLSSSAGSSSATAGASKGVGGGLGITKSRTLDFGSLKVNVENRIRDLGIGCDLVCLGEQPLHTVPLFRFLLPGDQYEKPDFINLMYYRDSPIKQDENMANISYVPRIGAQFIVRSDAGLGRSRSEPVNGITAELTTSEMTPPITLDEMDAYDAKIFECSTPISAIIPSRTEQTKGLAKYNVDGPNLASKWPTKSRLTRMRTSSNEHMPTHSISDGLHHHHHHHPSGSISIKSNKPKQTSQPRQIPSYRNDPNLRNKATSQRHMGKPNSLNDISYSYGKSEVSKLTKTYLKPEHRGPKKGVHPTRPLSISARVSTDGSQRLST